MEKLIAVLKDLNATEIAAIVIALAALFVYVFYKGWKHARLKATGLQTELAKRGAWLADTKDRLYIEERNTEALTHALDRANHAIAGEEYKLRVAREKIATLNAESEAVYENYLATQAELKVTGVELQYWQYFARRALECSRSQMAQSTQLIKDSLMSKNGATVADALESIESSMELIALANTPDLPKYIRDMRADGTREVIHLLPRLNRFVEERSRALDERLIVKIPAKSKPVLFAGSWTHLELILTTMFDNAQKHSVESSPMEFEFMPAERMSTLQLTNLSPAAVPEHVIRAANEMMVGDIQRPRFGLYLIEQIAIGYRAIFKIENLGFSKDGAGHLVRTSFSFSLR